MLGQLLVAIAVSVVALPRVQDEALRDRVGGLLERLLGDDAAARDSAEDALRKLGPRVLPLLPDTATAKDADRKARLERLRADLSEADEKAGLEPARVTIEGEGLRLTEVLRQLQSQTGNRITDLREAYGAEATNPALDLAVKDRPFFEALDEIAKKAGVAVGFFTGDGSVGLMPGAMEGEEPGYGMGPGTGLLTYSGPFRIDLKRISSARELSSGQARANAQFEVSWEPRLRPMLLSLAGAGIKIVDDRGEAVEPEVSDESTSTVLRPENPVAEVNVNMKAPDRAAKTLKSMTIKGEVTLPAGLRRFTFPKVTSPNSVQTQGDVKLTLVSTEIEENIWRVTVRIEMPGEGRAFESYQQGLFNNQLWLQKADGSRFEHNGGFSTTESGQGLLGFEYLFVDAPGAPDDYQFVYVTPSRVVTIPLEFTFENVPLP
jgi:hypothetical protein